MKTMKVWLDALVVGNRLRDADMAKVSSLAVSMQAIGLQQPISVWFAAEDTMHLVAGLHRVRAAEKLGWEQIDAIAVEMDDIDRDLWEIDENLCRAELSPTEEGEHLARRQELWKAREERGVSAQVGSKPQGGRPEGFASNTAKVTGKSKTAVNRAIQRTHEIASEARDLIRNTKLDTGAYLDKLMKVPEDEQVDRVQRDLAALADKDRREALKREAAEREREAKEARKAAKIAVCAFLLDALSSRQWDQLIDLVERAGGSVRASDLRDWQAPINEADAA